MKMKFLFVLALLISATQLFSQENVKINKDELASDTQIRYLRSLCKDRNFEYPFKSLDEVKHYLTRMRIQRTIQQILRGYTIVFVFPVND